MNNKTNIIARLESRLDILETELSNLNQLTKQVGFCDGIETLRAAAEELLNDPHILKKTS